MPSESRLHSPLIQHQRLILLHGIHVRWTLLALRRCSHSRLSACALSPSLQVRRRTGAISVQSASLALQAMLDIRTGLIMCRQGVVAYSSGACVSGRVRFRARVRNSGLTRVTEVMMTHLKLTDTRQTWAKDSRSCDALILSSVARRVGASVTVSFRFAEGICRSELRTSAKQR